MDLLTDYPRPSVTVDCIVFGYDTVSLSVLLLNRRESPFEGLWTLPGGFLRLEETLEETANRVLNTKTGIVDLYLEQLYTFGGIDRDPRGRVLSVAYYTLVSPERFTLMAGSMANDVRWFSLAALPELGFDHRAVIETAIQRLRAKVTYQPIGFDLLNPQFTIGELQHLYESILQTPLDRRNFHRKMMSMSILRATGQKRKGEKNRAPELFEFDRLRYEQLFQEGFQFNF